MQKAKHNGHAYHGKQPHLLKNKFATKRLRYFMPLMSRYNAITQKQLLPYEIAVGVGVGIIAASTVLWLKFKK